MTKQSILRYYCCACSLTLRRNCAGNSRILKMVTIYITVISSSPYAKSPDPGAVAAGPLEHLLCLPLQPLCLAPGQGDRTGELGWAGLPGRSCAQQGQPCTAHGSHRSAALQGLLEVWQRHQSHAWNHLLSIPHSCSLPLNSVEICFQISLKV